MRRLTSRIKIKRVDSRVRISRIQSQLTEMSTETKHQLQQQNYDINLGTHEKTQNYSKLVMEQEPSLNSNRISNGEENLKDKDYTLWSRDQLILRVLNLEEKLQTHSGKKNNLPSIEFKKERRYSSRPFDPSKYSTRLVAFKLAYLGKHYNGFEYHANNHTPLPTVEEELWKAFTKAKLIFPEDDQIIGNWDGCDYSKCGRTDKGVSAFGQVIGIRVRSNRPLGRKKTNFTRKDKNEVVLMEEQNVDEQRRTCKDQPGKKITSEFFNTLPRENSVDLASDYIRPPKVKRSSSKNVSEKQDNEIEHDLNFDPIADEIPYATILNRILPSDIRILAWCPAPPLDFSARFSCRERQYRYFFTQPCFLPTPNSIDPLHSSISTSKDGFLDIEAMRVAAKLYEGLHDFRNLCKVDASKQLLNFQRRIYYAGIEEVPGIISEFGFLNSSDFQLSNEPTCSVYPKVYSFTLHGSAFLWHQVRHMVAILFLVGQGLEEPSIVTKLLDIDQNPRRPAYQMAAETPLVLWNCVFAHENDSERKEVLQWIYVGDLPGMADSKYGVPSGGLMDDLWRNWRERKIDEILSSNLLCLVAGQGKSASDLKIRLPGKARSQKVFNGNDVPSLQGTYVPVMMKQLADTVEVINQRYATKKGFSSRTGSKEQDYRKLNDLREESYTKLDCQQ